MVCGLLAAVAFCNAVAIGERYEPATITVQQLVAKSREAAGRLVPGGYHIVESAKREDSALTEDTLELKGDYVTVVRDGPFTSSYGKVHGTKWSANENGVVAVSPNDDTVATNPYAVAIDALRTNTDDATMLGVTSDEPKCYVVELKPRSGLVERRFYDAKTFLLRRVETSDFRGETTTDYDDYRRAFGRMVPFHSTYIDSHNIKPIDFRLSTFEPAKPDPSVFAIPKSATVFDLGTASELAIPADFTRGGVIVRVTIAGRGLDFYLDSGASTTVINSDVARELGLTLYNPRKRQFGGEFTAAKTRVDDFALGEIHAKHFALYALPIDFPAGEKRVVGLLGSDFFSSARIRLSFKEKTLTMQSASVPIPSTWTKLPINVDEEVPMTKAAFNGVEGHFIFDTGAFETMLYPHYFSKFTPKSVGQPVGSVVTVSGHATKYREFTFSRFDLGDLAFADMLAIVAEGNTIEGVIEDGVIGRSFLSNFDIVFDYPNHTVYLSPQL